MKKVIVLTAMLLLGTFSTNIAEAADTVLECNNCTLSQYRNMAKNATPSNMSYGTYDVYVVDVVNNVLKRYMVMVESEPGMGTFKFPINATVEASYQNKFNDYVAAYNSFKDWEITQDTFNYPSGSAYDIRGGGNGQLITSISNYVWTNAQWNTQIAWYVGSGLALLGKIIDVNMVIYINFPDGTTAEMRILGIGQNGEVTFEYNDGSATDSQENNIPDSQAAFGGHTGNYTNANSINAFLAYAASMGVPITNGSGGSAKVTCHLEAGKMVCVLKTITK